MQAKKPNGLSSAWHTVREALSGVHHEYTEGSLPRAITLLAIPMVLEMAMESAFAICDIYWVSKLEEDTGPAAVATVGLTESMLTIVYALGLGLAMATTAMVARRIGEKDTDAASSSGAQAIYLGVLIGAVLGIPCFLLAPQLLTWMGAESDVIAEGSTFTSIVLGSNVVIMLLFINNAVFRGAGDAVYAMRSLWLANGINIVLDPCLIFGWGPFPELGLTGAAVATLIGRGTGVAYQLHLLHRGASRIRLSGPSLRIDPARMLRLLRLSAGGIGQFLIATSSWIVLMRIVSFFGSNALAGYTIAIRIIVFTLLPTWGLGNAAATLVGQSLGAGKPDRAERAVWMAGFFNMCFLGAVMVVFIALPRPLITIFTEDPEAVRTGIASLRIIAYGYLLYAWGMILAQAFNGAGDTTTPTWINFLCFWMLQIPLAWALARGTEMGVDGVFWAVAISESVLAVVSLAVFRRGRWKEREV